MDGRALLMAILQVIDVSLSFTSWSRRTSITRVFRVKGQAIRGAQPSGYTTKKISPRGTFRRGV
jgi:hypothetical protein